MVRRTRMAAVLTLALINAFTIAAGLAVVHLLPPRLAALRVPTVAAVPAVSAGSVLADGTGAGPLPTPSGLRAVLAGPLSAVALGPQVSAVVADPVTGQVLLSDHGAQPATLASLAAATAKALKADGRDAVSLGYDTSLYTGPGLAPSWPGGYVSGGDVTPIVSLEVDQGRLTAAGTPEDSDDPYNNNPRATDPAGMATGSFAALLTADGIRITGPPAAQAAPAGAQVVASVVSPPLSAIVEQMLEESNNVIAENLARHVALAIGEPASFGGAAAAVTRELGQLGITSGIRLVDGSGLSPADLISPDALVRMLELAITTPRLRPLLAGLPVAGFSGTLSAGQSVFSGIGGAALGSVRAKTGNLGTVAALAGLVYDKSGRVLVFAFMADAVPSAGLLQDAAQDIDKAASALAGCGCR